LIEPERGHLLQHLLTLTLEEKREALCDMGKAEVAIHMARFGFNHHSTTREIATSLAADKLIPCILHMKMRVLEKALHSIVNSALERYGEGKLDTLKRKQLSLYIETLMQLEVFGNRKKAITTQWKFRWQQLGQVAMEKPSFSGGNAEKVLQKFPLLVNLLYGKEMDEDAKGARERNMQYHSAWTQFADNHLLLWSLIEQKNDFTDLNIRQLHKWSNCFMDQWISLLGAVHMTNYVHIIGAGHLTYFVSKYRNLYRFSQQGWESFNQLLKHYYFNNTNHGGSLGNGGKDQNGEYSHGTVSGDHCYPLMRLCQRNIMWKLGLGDTYFENLYPKEITDNNQMEVEQNNQQETLLPLEFGII
jgi:hypothetical protein